MFSRESLVLYPIPDAAQIPSNSQSSLYIDLRLETVIR